ncbi:hypothetical protein SCLCIDRAFT_408288 [Scleroderma citrinum Foug A]|uniref:Uncharacterized protein n=1 Tax=Scleroderma citrinum Foug A TaxID=1036808 RepID=A0A0C3DCM4_9AGAM|nr:hypothetical protein SCLCIDRAFT_408288 [Scleroderma citrinum Foug A]
MAFRSHGTVVGEVGAGDGEVVNQINNANWESYESNPAWPMRPHAGDGYRYGARTTFTLPVDADSLYLFARGAYQHGNVRIIQSGTVERGTVHVEIRAAYHEERALSRVALYRLRRGSNEHGIGIYTPVWGWTLNHRDQVQFQVTFTFPTSPAETPLRIRRFETETGLFSYTLGNLYETMFFDQISITTSNSNIKVESITLEHGIFKSSNGYIAGHYNASRLLKLVTSNEQIKATILLFDGDSSGTELEMQTCNSPIKSEVSLISQSNTGGTFRVSARSSNSPISLQYAEAPPTSTLTSNVTTSNNEALVKMHSTFEGTFEVATSNASSVLKASRGDDGRRVIHQRKVGSSIVGSVSWGERRRLRGSTSVRSSNGRVSLEV